MPRPSSRLRVLAAIAIVIAPAALLGASYPGGLGQMLQDVNDCDSNRKLLDSNRLEAERFDREAGQMHHLYVEKMECVEELVSGRETLRSVTRRFIEIDRDTPSTIQMVERIFPGATYEEKAARYLFDFMRARLQVGPSPSGVRERIQLQFHEMFGNAADLT